MRLGINIKGKIEKNAGDMEISISPFDTPDQIKMPDYKVTIKSGSKYDIFLPYGKLKIKISKIHRTCHGIINQLTPVTLDDIYNLINHLGSWSDEDRIDTSSEIFIKNLEVEKLKCEVESLSEQLRNALDGIQSVSDINMRIEMLTREHSGLVWEFDQGQIEISSHETLGDLISKKVKYFTKYPTLKATIELD